MPKKAVGLFFLAAFIGAAIFVYFTFPRTKDEIPTSNNQRPFPSAPEPTPNSVPVPETVPRPNTPKVPPGPTLHVMAWASAAESRAVEGETDAFAAATGRHVSLTIDSDAADYRRDLRQAVASDSPPDVCLVAARDFSGLDPARDLAAATPTPGTAPRSIAAFTTGAQIKAAPNEFSVDVLFYNPSYFDQAGIGYPDRHWTWDILESDARALASLKLKDPQGHPIVPLELPADFDFWNVLCAQAGHPALDLDVWHIADADTRDSQIRALDFIHDVFHEYAIAAPPQAGEISSGLFAQQRAALLIAPSESIATLPPFSYALTLLPEDMARASLVRINGWAVMARSADPDAARALATYLAYQPVHAGWSSVLPPAADDARATICYEALGQALVPRLDPKTARLAQFLDQQINGLARNPTEKTDDLYTRIQTEYQSETSPPAVAGDIPQAAPQPVPKAEGVGQLRGL